MVRVDPVDDLAGGDAAVTGEARHISDAALEVLKGFEGCVLTGYLCSAGVPTVGYGHTGPEVTLHSRITKAEAERLLRQDLDRFERAVQRLVKVPLKQHQFDALVMFAFNVGVGALENSTLLRMLNAGDYDAVPAQILRWDKAKGATIAGLTRRRKREATMFHEEPLT